MSLHYFAEKNFLQVRGWQLQMEEVMLEPALQLEIFCGVILSFKILMALLLFCILMHLVRIQGPWSKVHFLRTLILLM